MRRCKGAGVFVASGFLAAISFSTHTAGAQSAGTIDASDDVILVKAQRRAERAEDVPITVTSISQDEIRKTAVQDLADIVKLTPALRFDYQGGFAQPTIRGIGSAVTTSGSGSNVGIYIDGFYSPNPLQADFQFLNVESVQVLKGPQGTLFGRNTTGGAILVETRDPAFETGGAAQVSFERFGGERIEGYGTTGLGEMFAVDAAVAYEQSDGYLRNIVTGNEDAGQFDRWSVRTGLLFRPSDRISFLLRYTNREVEDPLPYATNAYVADDGVVAPDGTVLSAAAAFGAPVATDAREVSFGSENLFSSRAEVVQLRSTFDLGFADLTSYTQYRYETARSVQDFDASALALFDLEFFNKDRIWTQELLLTSVGEGPLQWTAGLFFLDNVNRFYPVNASFGGAPFGRFGGSGTTTTSQAAFADATYRLLPQLFLTAGVRYSRNRVSEAFYDPGPVRVAIGAAQSVGAVPVEGIDEDRITPRLVVRYEPGANSSVYASYSRGYKAGILNVGGFSDEQIAPEDLDAFEIGYKYGGARFSFDAAAFRYDYEDLQLSSFDSQTSIVKNAADSRIQGLEASGRFEVLEGFSIRFGGAYIDSEYEEFVDSPLSVQCLDPVACGPAFGLFPAGQVVDASGNELLRTPEFTGNLGTDYVMSFMGGELNLSGNLYYSSDFYFDSSNQFEQEAFELLTLRAEWTEPQGRYSVAVYGDNVTNAEYRSQVLPGQFAILQTWARPAIWGVTLRANF